LKCTAFESDKIVVVVVVVETDRNSKAIYNCNFVQFLSKIKF